MPGPGPRGPRQTYRAPCSSIPDSRISARNPRKTGKSRRARGTRTRQPGTRSTRDGFPQLDFVLQPPDIGPRSSKSARSRPAIDYTDPNSRLARGTRPRQPATSSTRDGLLFVKPGCKHAGTSSSSSSSSPGSDPPASRHWAPGSDPPASIPESSFQMPASSSWHREQQVGAPGHRVIFLAKSTGCRRSSPAGPYAGRRCHGPCF